LLDKSISFIRLLIITYLDKKYVRYYSIYRIVPNEYIINGGIKMSDWKAIPFISSGKAAGFIPVNHPLMPCPMPPSPSSMAWTGQRITAFPPAACRIKPLTTSYRISLLLERCRIALNGLPWYGRWCGRIRPMKGWCLKTTGTIRYNKLRIAVAGKHVRSVDIWKLNIA